jgi:[ribosomal protein S5]-alanine N-acetyltransferase
MHLHTTIPEVQLVSWAPQHLQELVAQANDRAVWRNLFDTFPHPYTPEDAEFWVKHTAESEPSCHLCILVGGRVAGGIGIEVGSGTEAKTGQFGYWLGTNYWGRGIATAAASAMVSHARSRMPLARLQAPIFAWNPRSMRVVEKAGFHREAVLRSSVFKDGELIDSVLYALILSDA